jgi:hypothetical protein
MKTLHLIFAFLLLPTFLLSQKIDIKKDKVIYNEKEVAIVNSPFRNHFEFLTLSGEKIFELDLKGVGLTADEMLFYMIITDGKTTTQVPYEITITSLKVARVITHQLALKYHLIDEKGINQDELHKFLSVERENLGDKYLAMKMKAKEEQNTKNAKINSVISIYNPRMGKSGEVLYGNAYNARIAGYVKLYSCDAFTRNPCMEVWDLDGIKVAQMYPAKGMKNYLVSTYDGREFTFEASRPYAPSDYVFVTDLVVNLILNDYKLEHYENYKRAELQNAKIKDAVARSINLYDVPGYAVDKKGKKHEGNLTIWYEKLDVERTGEKLPEIGADMYGQQVTVKTVNNLGSFTRTFNADSGAYFCAQFNDGEDCYYGLSVKGELMKKLQNFGDLHGNNSYFYKLIEKKNNIMLLQDPVELQKYVVKVNNQSMGQMIDNRSNDKLSEKLAEYLKDCKKISDEIKDKTLDVKSEDNLKYVIDEYSKCKK